MTAPVQRLRGECRGTTAVEFAMIASVMLPLLFGILDLGLLMWTRNALQSTAALTARCVAIGSSLCTNGRAFAVNTAGEWILSGIISTTNVTVTNPATSCNGAAGSFVTVAISSSYWILPPPFGASTLRVTGCFPV